MTGIWLPIAVVAVHAAVLVAAWLYVRSVWVGLAEVHHFCDTCDRQDVPMGSMVDASRDLHRAIHYPFRALVEALLRRLS